MAGTPVPEGTTGNFDFTDTGENQSSIRYYRVLSN
jgi:hypothetical protein